MQDRHSSSATGASVPGWKGMLRSAADAAPKPRSHSLSAHLLLVLLLLVVPWQFAAAEALDVPYLSLGGGVMDANRGDDPERDAWSVNLAFAGKRSFAPFAGFMRDTDGARAAYAGVYGFYSLSSRWVLAGSFAPAAYWRGESKDLGSTLQFRSGLGIFYCVERGVHFGAAIHHLSNGRLYDRNPGTELIGLYLALPLGSRD